MVHIYIYAYTLHVVKMNAWVPAATLKLQVYGWGNQAPRDLRGRSQDKLVGYRLCKSLWASNLAISFPHVLCRNPLWIFDCPWTWI